LGIGEVVKFFEDEDFEHEDNVEGVATEMVRIVLIADCVEIVAKDFPVDDGVEFGKEVVDLIDLIELCFEVEEAELSFGFAHGNVAKGEMMNESIVTQGRNLSRRKHSTDK
jgi:hypothetical protein